MGVLPWTRRGVLATGTALALSLGLPAAAQTPPGVLIVGQIAEPKALDPAAVTAVNDFRILMNVYDGLVRYKSGTLEVEPALATSWEISEDGTEYTFALREGVSFHDGSPFDAEAVVFNFERMLNERQKAQLQRLKNDRRRHYGLEEEILDDIPMLLDDAPDASIE